MTAVQQRSTVRLFGGESEQAASCAACGEWTDGNVAEWAAGHDCPASARGVQRLLRDAADGVRDHIARRGPNARLPGSVWLRIANAVEELGGAERIAGSPNCALVAVEASRRLRAAAEAAEAA